MNKILSFIKLDFYTILYYLKYILVFFGVGIIFGMATQMISILISFFTVGVLLILTYTFSVCEKSKMETLYNILPISRKKAVAGRYLFTFIIIIIFSILTLSVLFIMNSVFTLGLGNLEVFTMACLLFALVAMVTAIQFPLYFLLGYNKARLIGYLPMGAVIVLINLLLSNDKINAHLVNISNNVLVSLLSILTALILLGISYIVTYKLYEKKNI